MGTWYVKLARGAWETVVSVQDSREGAELAAARFNVQYQTDEYFVERHDPARAGFVKGRGNDAV